jgi:hypothetical protein
MMLNIHVLDQHVDHDYLHSLLSIVNESSWQDEIRGYFRLVEEEPSHSCTPKSSNAILLAIFWVGEACARRDGDCGSGKE